MMRGTKVKVTEAKVKRPNPKKMACTSQSKILAISSNPETIGLLLIVGELWDPEVNHDKISNNLPLIKYRHHIIM